MSFGWSAGDVIGGINVLIQVFQALDDSRGGKASYAELIRELSSLQNALQGIRKLGIEASLDDAVLNCRKCIDGFVERIKKFKGMDKDYGTSVWSFEAFKKNARAVEWAMCKKGEVDDFRRAVLFHTAAILSLQISALSDEAQRNVKEQTKAQKGLIAQGQDQGAILAAVQNELQAVITSQERLLGNVDAASHDHKQLSVELKSQASEISESQIEHRVILDHINAGVTNIESNVDRIAHETRKTSEELSGSAFKKLASSCLKALYVTDPSVDRKEIETRKDKLMDNSCDWILPQFCDFLADNLATRLWIHGTLGKGKIMISMALVDELLGRVHSDLTSLCGYFFCDNTSDKRNSLLAVMKTLLRGVLEVFLQQQTEASTEFLGTFDVKGEAMFSSVEAVWIELHRALQFTTLTTVYFVVDALDECDEESLESFFVLVTDENAPQASAQPGRLPCRVKWILLSRNEGAIKDSLGTSTSTLKVDLEVNSKAVRQSVDQFIGIKVEALAVFKRYDPDLKNFVATTLREKAEGTFLWVSLACRELRRPKVRSINTKQVLEMMPRGLSQLYDRIYQQAISSDIPEMVDHVKQILRSVTLASHPLSPAELAVTAGLPSSAIWDIKIVKEYIEQCGSLIVLRNSEEVSRSRSRYFGRRRFRAHSQSPDSISDSSDYGPRQGFLDALEENALRKGTIHFIHQSAKDYMLEHTKVLFSQNCAREHEDIALRCLQYINTFQVSMEKDVELKGLAIAIDIAKNMRRGLRYPLQYWIEHAGHAVKKMALLKDADFVLLQRRSTLFQAWVSIFGPEALLQDKLQFRPLHHYAAYQGIIWLLSWVLQNHGQVALHETYLQDGTTSLTWAIKARDTEVARWLLERGACPNTCERTKHFLLGRKAQRKRSNAFSHVSQVTPKQSESRSQPHIDTEPQTVREQYQTGLFIAAVESPTMFELLLEFGADINFKLPTGETSLFLAVSWLRRGEGFFKACKLFLERGADPNICSSNGQSPLHLAARWSQDIVALLLSHGADPKARDKKGRTPLDWAAYHENLEVVSLLCTSGADPDQIDNENHAPLYYAAFYGIQPVVKILIEHGANIAQFEEGARDHNSRLGDDSYF